MLKEREEHVKRINSLVLPKSEQQGSSHAVSDDDIKQSSLYVETSTKLASAERQLQELREQMKHVKEQWAKAKGDAELAMKSLHEIQIKHKKRWRELTKGGESSFSNESKSQDGDASSAPASSDSDGMGDQRIVKQAQHTVELEHKLKQALENVRQAETVRISLAEAVKMNEGLQAKLEELKIKNAALMAGKSASRANASDYTAPSSSSLSTPGSKERSSSHGSSSASTEKLQKEHRRMRKELAAALTSKEGAKAKQEVGFCAQCDEGMHVFVAAPHHV